MMKLQNKEIKVTMTKNLPCLWVGRILSKYYYQNNSQVKCDFNQNPQDILFRSRKHDATIHIERSTSDFK